MTEICHTRHTNLHLLFGTKDYSRRIISEIFYYYHCHSCRLIYLSPIPNDLGQYYLKNYYSILSPGNELAQMVVSELLYNIDTMKHLATGGRLMKIDPACDSFIYFAKQSGFDAKAIDLDTN